MTKILEQEHVQFLTHFRAVFPFNTPLLPPPSKNIQKLLIFDISKGYRKGTLILNGLRCSSKYSLPDM